VVYVVYVAALFTGVPFLFGAIIAWLKRGSAAGTIYESHFANQLRIFWIGLLVFVVGWLTLIILIGWVILGLGWLWAAWRTGIGVMRAMDAKPY
jgi:uncharacterized membrane protein